MGTRGRNCWIGLGLALAGCGPGLVGGDEGLTLADDSTTHSETQTTQGDGDGDGDPGDGDGDPGDGDGDPAGDGDGDGDPGDGDGDGDGDPGDGDGDPAGDGDGDPGDGDGDPGDGDGDPGNGDGDGDDPGDNWVATLEPGPDWPAEWSILTARRIADQPVLMLGGHTVLGQFDHEVRVLSLSPEGDTLTVSPLPLPPAGRTVTAIEALEGNDVAWVNGWSFDEGIQNDDPGWFWIAQLEADGSWSWVLDTEHHGMPVTTALRPDAGAVILGQSATLSVSNTLFGLDESAQLLWTTPDWHDFELEQSSLDLALTGNLAIITGGGERVRNDQFELVAEHLSLAHFSPTGTLMAQTTHVSPDNPFAAVRTLRYDSLNDSLMALVSEHAGLGEPEQLALVELDPSGEQALSWRSIGPGEAVELEVHAGTAHVLRLIEGEMNLAHYASAPELAPTWSTTRAHGALDLAVDRLAGEAYVLSEVGIEVFALQD